VALVHTDQGSEECSRKRSRLSIVQSSSGCRAASDGAPQSSTGWWGACNWGPRIFPWWRQV